MTTDTTASSAMTASSAGCQPAPAPTSRPSANGAAAPTNAPNEEAVSALVNLGFSRTEAFGAVARAGQSLGDAAGVNDLIRGGLKELAQ